MMLSPGFLKQNDRALTRLARPAVVALRSLVAFRAPVDRPLILRPGGMGDLICAQIALEEMDLDPKGVDWLIERRSEPWARRQRLRYYCYDAKPLSIVLTMTGTRRLVIDTEQLFGLSHTFAALLRGNKGRLIGFSTNRGAGNEQATVPYDWRDAHESVSFSNLFAAAFEKKSQIHPPSRFRRTPATSGLMVAIAGRQEPARDIGLDRWRELLTPWLGDRLFTLVNAPIDDEFAEALTENFPRQCRRERGSFDKICDLLAASERLFTIDGGMVHVASYYGVPTTAIFTNGRDLKWAPLAQGSEIIRHGSLTCQPCTKFGQTPPCPNRHACHSISYPANRQTIDQASPVPAHA